MPFPVILAAGAGIGYLGYKSYAASQAYLKTWTVGFDRLKALWVDLDRLRKIFDKEVPDLKIYSTKSAWAIWQGLGKIRTSILSRTGKMVELAAALTPYRAALMAAQSAGAQDVMMPGYAFRPLISLELKKAQEAVGAALGAHATALIFNTASVDGIVDGIKTMYSGIATAIETTVGAISGAAGMLSFALKNWPIIAAGAAYYFFVAKKRAA